MQRIIINTLFLALSVNSFAQESWKKGNGTEKKPYILETAEQLFALAQAVNNGNSFENTYFELANDIDLQCSQSKLWTPIGSKEPTPFKGFFNGKNYTLSGLLVNDSALYNAGLFGFVFMGKVENVRIVKSSFSANCYVGSVVGYLMGGEVYNCYNEATVAGKDNVGGIVGQAYTAKINACVNHGNVVGKLHVGGIVGAGYGNVQILNSYNRSYISGFQYVGGIAGKVEGSAKKAIVKSCYQEDVFCKIGVIGASSLAVVENCYYADVAGIGNFTEGTKIAYSEMKTDDFLSRLNQAGGLWKKDPKISVNSGYPILKTAVYKGIITNEATDVTFDDATLNGSVLSDVKEKIIRKGFELWEEGGGDTTRFFVLTNPLYYTITDLKSAQIYHYRTIVVTSTQTLYGDVQAFRTLLQPHKHGEGCGHPHHH